MAVHDIAYVELYTSNKKSVVDHLVSATGFTHLAEAVDVDRSSALLRQGTAQLVVTTGPATWKFLKTHGDGIADIALACDDVDQTRRSALAAGATVASPAHSAAPTVSGLDGVAHTLLPAAEGPPPGRNWGAVPNASRGAADGRTRLLDHIAICVGGTTLDKSGDFYRAAFGLGRHRAEHLDDGDHATDSVELRSPSGRIAFTLVAPDPRKGPGPLDAFLERGGGPGVRHLAFRYENGTRDGRGLHFLTLPDDCRDGAGRRYLRDARVGADG